MEAYLRNMVDGCHCSWNRFESDEESLGRQLDRIEDLLGFEDLAMTALAVKVCPKKKTKGKRAE